MTITTADLLLLSPVLVLTGTVVLAMSAIAVGRNYPGTAIITVAGLFLAAVGAVLRVDRIATLVSHFVQSS